MFRALACDYDGTLATGDRIGPGTLSALERVRAVGVRLVLVSDGAHVQDLAPSPPVRLVAELDRRAIAYQLGRVVLGFPG